jgi:co-chaperonin GroES (HSP10)
MIKQILGYRVVIDKEVPKDTTDSGIYIGKQVRDPIWGKGIVKILGIEAQALDDKLDPPISIRGKRVLYPLYAEIEEDTIDIRKLLTPEDNIGYAVVVNYGNITAILEDTQSISGTAKPKQRLKNNKTK